MGADRPRDAAARGVLTQRVQRFGGAPRSERAEQPDPPEQAEPPHAFSVPLEREIAVHWLPSALRDLTFPVSVRRPSGRNGRTPLVAERAGDPLLWEGLRVSIMAGRRAHSASRPALLLPVIPHCVRWAAEPRPMTSAGTHRPLQPRWPRPCACRRSRRARSQVARPAPKPSPRHAEVRGVRRQPRRVRSMPGARWHRLPSRSRQRQATGRTRSPRARDVRGACGAPVPRGHDSPPIRHLFNVSFACVNHRLNCKNHACF